MSEPMTTVEFVQDWLMNADYDPTQFDKDFAAAIDARVNAAYEAASKVAELAAFGCEITTVDEKGWPTTGAGGAKHTADYIATAIRALATTPARNTSQIGEG